MRYNFEIRTVNNKWYIWDRENKVYLFSDDRILRYRPETENKENIYYKTKEDAQRQLNKQDIENNFITLEEFQI